MIVCVNMLIWLNVLVSYISVWLCHYISSFEHCLLYSVIITYILFFRWGISLCYKMMCKYCQPFFTGIDVIIMKFIFLLSSLHCRKVLGNPFSVGLVLWQTLFIPEDVWILMDLMLVSLAPASFSPLKLIHVISTSFTCFLDWNSRLIRDCIISYATSLALRHIFPSCASCSSPFVLSIHWLPETWPTEPPVPVTRILLDIVFF